MPCDRGGRDARWPGRPGHRLEARPAAAASGRCCAMRAAAPATCGVAIDVPPARVQCSSTTVPMAVPAARAATVPTPGAAMSGLKAPSPNRGPRLEKEAISSSRSTAGTVSASSAAPGNPTVPLPGPLLPAATTKRVPVVRLIWLSAWLDTSVPSVAPPPRLMLTTLAPERPAHSMPAMMSDVHPEPSSSSTLPTRSLAPGATPLRSSSDAAPLPRTVAATWVPCPCPSRARGAAPVKSTCGCLQIGAQRGDDPLAQPVLVLRTGEADVVGPDELEAGTEAVPGLQFLYGALLCHSSSRALALRSLIPGPVPRSASRFARHGAPPSVPSAGHARPRTTHAVHPRRSSAPAGSPGPVPVAP